VTRKDLAPGYQAVQSAHAIPQYAIEHPESFKDWYHNSNYLIILSTINEQSLEFLIAKLKSKGLKYSVFREPDINNQITSVAIEPHKSTYKLVSNIPLALKEYNSYFCNK
jgi:predicted transcriptional regulator